MRFADTASTIPQHHIQNGYSEKCILIVDDDPLFRKLFGKKLENAGFTNTHCVMEPYSAIRFLEMYCCDVVFLDIGIDEKEDEKLRFLEMIRNRGFRNSVAMLSACPSQDCLLRAAICGANDFLVKTLRLDIVPATLRLLQKKIGIQRFNSDTDIFDNSGFMQSMGLTPSDIKLLKEYSKGFPRYTELAHRLGRPCVQIRKQFSGIYKKLHKHLKIENPAQLSSLITIFSLFQ
jgi:DNA-binding NarL/FixJ family response regulator